MASGLDVAGMRPPLGREEEAAKRRELRLSGRWRPRREQKPANEQGARAGTPRLWRLGSQVKGGSRKRAWLRESDAAEGPGEARAGHHWLSGKQLLGTDGRRIHTGVDEAGDWSGRDEELR